MMWKILLTFILVVLVGGGIMLSMVGIPSPKKEIRRSVSIENNDSYTE